MDPTQTATGIVGHRRAALAVGGDTPKVYQTPYCYSVARQVAQRMAYDLTRPKEAWSQNE
jgi:hypothetical protein